MEIDIKESPGCGVLSDLTQFKAAATSGDLDNNNQVVKSSANMNLFHQKEEVYLENNKPLVVDNLTSATPLLPSPLLSIKSLSPNSDRSSATRQCDIMSHSSYQSTSDLESGDGSTSATVTKSMTIQDCDIVCNTDGSCFVVHVTHSCKVRTPSSLLCASTDVCCPSFPVAVKTLGVIREPEDVMVDHYVVRSSVPDCTILSKDDKSIVLCIPCKLLFSSISALRTHAANSHKLNELSSHSAIGLGESAILTHVLGGQFHISPLLFKESVPLSSISKSETTTSLPVTNSSSFTSPTQPSPQKNSSRRHSLVGYQSSHFSSLQNAGGCDEHPDGGIECPKCDIVLSSARSLGGHMTMMHSRNSCKTLKCPKCNWHYKYQETLEIHMKEKHPDTEQTCIYCTTRRSHPKLSRGESYMCGFKPYRCEVCNYSTTTKGNLSIHMQSDKHINNMQEYKNGGSSPIMPPAQVSSENILSPPLTPIAVSSSSASVSTLNSPPVATVRHKQQKGSWRCDVCNYETNIARNLRIHMTSEKHTHNMIILQQNVKSMQQNMRVTMNKLSMYPGQDTASVQQQLGTMFPFDPMGIVGQIEALQHFSGESSNDTDKLTEEMSNFQTRRCKHVFGCVICNAFSTDDLVQLEQHLSVDRSMTTSTEHVTITPENHYLCSLCQYKTSLKANFQLHCKTDKHVQRVQLVNHIREGGQKNEWRMRYLNMPNPVHIVCNVCSYQSNNIHKMRIHSLSLPHSLGASLFKHLQRDTEEMVLNHYVCKACDTQTSTKALMVEHARQIHAPQLELMCADGWTQFLVKTGSPAIIPATSASADEEESDKLEKDVDVASQEEDSFKISADTIMQKHISMKHESSLPCPLCSERFSTVDSLEQHLSATHNVSKEGAKRLLALIDTTSWNTSNEDGEDDGDWYRCQMCPKMFKDFDQLCFHQSKQDHLEVKTTPRGPGYLCSKKGCNQYFKTAQALQVHFREIHVSKPVTNATINKNKQNSGVNLSVKASNSSNGKNSIDCFICNRSFRNDMALRKHVEGSHFDTMDERELAMYREFMSSGVTSKCSEDMSTEEDDNSSLMIDESAGTYVNTDCGSSKKANIESSEDIDGSKSVHCELCDLTFSQAGLLQVHLTSSLHRSKQMEEMVNGSVPIIRSEIARRDERPYKCNVCDVAYSQSKALDVHLRSVEHHEASVKFTNNMPHSKDEPSASSLSKEENGVTITKFQVSANDQDQLSTSQAERSKDNQIIWSEEEDCTPEKRACSRGSASISQMLTCHLCGFMFTSDDALTQHQQLCGASARRQRGGASRRHTHRQLLQNFGIECVMGFLETEQQTRANSTTEPQEQLDLDNTSVESNSEEKENSIPEMSGKQMCDDCGKEFSGLWVLKAHKEDAHSQLLPESITEHFGNLYKEDFDAKEVVTMKAASLLTNTSKSSTELTRRQEVPATGASSPTVKQEPNYSANSIINTVNNMPMMTNPMDILTLQAAASSMPWLANLFPMGFMPGSMFSMMPNSVPTSTTGGKVSDVLTPNLTSPSLNTTSSIASRTQPLTTTSHHHQGSGEKRARTRISDEQLKVLRQYFDINNSPSEQEILEMADKTGLPAKVIKHWFRNTLFKERQRNKDSPYNFNNPPQTTLNLEEYEKTGRVPQEKNSISDQSRKSFSQSERKPTPPSIVTSPDTIHQRMEENVESGSRPERTSVATTVTESDDSVLSPTSPTPSSSENSNLYYDMFSSPSYKFTDYSSASNSKRANRTRFTDFQIKSLQEYFEQNAYPKDDKLENLSRMLRLPNRVIVVWFQNARQKARKVYENTPSSAAESSTVTSTSKNSSYSCKKCGVTFTGYYELVKHQKRVCMKNNVVPLPFTTDSTEKLDTPSRVMETSSSSSPQHRNNKPQRMVSPPASTSSMTASQTAAALTSGFPNLPGLSAGLSTVDMAKMMYGGAINPLLMPFMPMPPMMGSNAMQNTIKGLYEQSIKKMMEESQPKPTLSSQITVEPVSLKTSSEGPTESPLDLSKAQKVNNSPDIYTNTLTAGSLQQDDCISVGESDITEELDDSMNGHVRTLSGGHGRSQGKRYRTNLTSMQIHVMKNMFKQYKTPTMAECEVLGSFIGLQKRVVQVWFQNARAKEKKSRLVYSQAYNRTIEDDPLEEECTSCGVTYSHKCTLQDHLFSPRHIMQVQRSFNGKLTEADRHAMRSHAERKSSLDSNSAPITSFQKRKNSDGNTSISTSSAQTSTHRQRDSQNNTKNILSSVNPMSAAAVGMMGLPSSMDLLSMMYPGVLGPMPGLMPPLMPGTLSDPAMMSAAMFNPLDFGTPLDLLQIPSSAIRNIASKLNDLDCTSSSYTQDGLTLNDLTKELSHNDVAAVKTTDVDVGFACRKCRFVFPRRDACTNHQASTCYTDKQSSTDTMLKIEQQLFTCRACNEDFSTVQEFRLHCQLDTHRNALSKWSSNNNEPNEESAAKRIRVQ